MRILIILHQFYPEFCGGTERVALGLAKAAQRAGHYVRVLACTVDPAASGGRPSGHLEGAREIIYHGIPVTLLPRTHLPALADISFETAPALVERLVSWMEQERFDVAHVLHPMRMGSALLAVQHIGLPYLLTLTDFFMPCYRINLVNVRNELCTGPRAGAHCAENCAVAPFTGESLAERYRQAQGLLSAAGVRACPSEYVARRYREAFPGLEFAVLPHGIDMRALGSVASPVTHTDAGKAGLTFGFIGAIVPQKGLDVLLRAFSRVASPTLKLRVIGGFYGDPTYHREVKRLAAADGRIELHGQMSTEHVFETIHSLDVLCLPSRVPETFSLVLHEAAAAGVPALVSDLGAPGERIAQLGGGLALAVDNVDAWAEAIAALAENPERLDVWRAELLLPLCIEEEAFFYESLYRQFLQPA
ncbi:MAG: glycosyltransferase [Sulfuriferula sp.]